jgi:Pyruvate/2-oxoacid:ferredoxin oxidoreductase gamma subunit
MNLPSLDKFEDMVVPGGLIIYDSSLINRAPKRTDVEVIAIPATELADKLGNTRIANMVILGAYIEITGVLKKETVFDALPNFLKRKTLVPLNKLAIEKGMVFVREELNVT